MRDKKETQNQLKHSALNKLSKIKNLEKTLVVILKNSQLKKFGTTITGARRRMGMSQAQLGSELWKGEDIPLSTAQTRIYRVENGIQELDVKTTERLLNILRVTDIDPHTLAPYGESILREDMILDKIAFQLYPNLPHFFKLINEYLRSHDLRGAILITMALFRYLFKTKPSIPDDWDMDQVKLPLATKNRKK